MAGEANKRVVFLFADTQIKEEGFVEDISNLLNTYEVREDRGWACEVWVCLWPVCCKKELLCDLQGPHATFCRAPLRSGLTLRPDP